MVAVTKLLLLALSLLAIFAEKAAAESLVISALVDCPLFSLVEFTACSDIANLNAYSFNEYQHVEFSDADYTYVGDNLANIKAGTKIYVATTFDGDRFGLNSAKFNDFFGYTPSHLYFSDNVQFFGNTTLQLVKKSAVVDIYGTVSEDFSNTDSNFWLGWAVRKAGKSPSATFNAADWIVATEVYDDATTTTNALATIPVVLGTYTCPININIVVKPGTCFSERNTVEVEGKGVIPMNHLEIGDKVKDAENNMVSVYSFGHYQPDAVAEYLQIHVQDLAHPLEVSKDHLVFVNGSAIPASKVSVGDEIDTSISAVANLSSSSSSSSCTTTTARVEKVQVVNRKGVYAPFTTSGTIMVSGVAASSYVTLQPNSAVVVLGDNNNNDDNNNNNYYQTGLSMHWLSHVFQTPHRYLCMYVLGLSTCRKWETYNDDGISHWAAVPYQMVSTFSFTMITRSSGLGMVMAAMALFGTFVLGLMLHAMEHGGGGGVWMIISLVLVITLACTFGLKQVHKKRVG